MCLIAVLKAGTDKYNDFIIEGIKKAALSNTDGIGYAFKQASNKDQVYISKGYNDVDAFIKVYKSKQLKEQDEVIIHLRIGNKGAVNTDMNHPFVISNEEELILTNGGKTTLPVLAHNGTFTEFSVYNSKFSDTYFFVKDFMSIPEFQDLLKRDISTFKRIFKSILGTNKLAFIFPGEQELITIGEYIEDENYLFSNKSYKESRYRNVGGYEYTDEYDYYNGYQRQQVVQLKSIGEDDIDPRPFDLSESVQDKFSVRNLYPVFGGALYVPYTYTNTQYQESKFVPLDFNYKHFRIYCKTAQYTLGLKAYENYKMVEYDESTSRQCHILKLMSDSEDNWQNGAYVDTKEILAHCSIHPTADYMVNYIEVFKLMKTFTASRKLYSHIKGQIGMMEASKKRSAAFKQITSIQLNSLKIWFNYLTYWMYPEDYKKSGVLYQVQPEDTETEPRVYVD